MAFKKRLKFDKRIKFQKQMSITYILLFVVMLCLGTGYAYINSDLNINGTAKVKNASFDVHFDNLNVTTGSVTATTPASITDTTTVGFAATLENPGDFYEFTVDVVNNGTMDAMIDNFSISPTLTTAQAKYLEYKITYSDGTELENKQELLAGATENLKVRFKYKTNSDTANYPTEDQTFIVAFTVTYTQADDTAVGVNHPSYVYTVNREIGEIVILGQVIPSEITQYTSAADALAALRLSTDDNSIQFYLKHRISEGIVKESYVEFIITPEMANANSGMTAGTYAIRGLDTFDENVECKSEYYDTSTNLCTSPYYESNKETVLSAFGSSSDCSETINDDEKSYECYASSPSFYVIIRLNGRVHVGNGSWGCTTAENGYSDCEGESAS